MIFFYYFHEKEIINENVIKNFNNIQINFFSRLRRSLNKIFEITFYFFDFYCVSKLNFKKFS